MKTSSWQRDASCQTLATVAPSWRFSSVSRPLRKLRNDCIIEMRRNGDVGALSVAISDRILQCDHSLTETLLLRDVARGLKPYPFQTMLRSHEAYRRGVQSAAAQPLLRAADEKHRLETADISKAFVNSTPSAHTFFSCSFCQRACLRLLSQLFRLQQHSHALTPRTRVARGANWLCRASKKSHLIAQCHTLRLTRALHLDRARALLPYRRHNLPDIHLSASFNPAQIYDLT